MMQDELRDIFNSDSTHIKRLNNGKILEVGICEKCGKYGDVDEWEYVACESDYCLCCTCRELVNNFININRSNMK